MSVMPASNVEDRIASLESQLLIVKRQLYEVRCAYQQTTTKQPDARDDEEPDEEQACAVS